MKPGILQRIVQTVFLIATNSNFNFLKQNGNSVYDGPEKQVCLPVIHCHSCPTNRFTCPIGAIQYSLSKTENPTAVIPWYVTGILFLTMMVLGRASCGWFCPFGLLQDLLGKISKKKIKIPALLNYLKYGILVGLVILAPLADGHHWFSRFCPSGTLFAGFPHIAMDPLLRETLGWLFVVKVVVLIGVLVMSVLVDRFFCRTLCPLGAILGLFNKFSLLSVKVNETCTSCNACVKTCPMGISAESAATSPECIRCMRCSWCKHVSVTFTGIPITGSQKPVKTREPAATEQNMAG